MAKKEQKKLAHPEVAEARDPEVEQALAEEAVAQELVSMLLRVDDDGQRVHSDDEVRQFLPFVLLSLTDSIDQSMLSAQTEELVGAFAEGVGVTGEMEPEEIREIINRHYEQNPVNPELVKDFERFLREYMSSESAGKVANEFARFVGQEQKGALSTVGAERPAGTVGASPMARFQLNQDPIPRKDG